MNSKKIVSFLQLMVSGLVLYLASGVIFAPSVHASSIPGCDDGNAPIASGAWNRSEDRAACYLQHKRACPQGALWMNTSTSTAGWGRESGYYSTTVNAAATENYATVYLHGSGIDYYSQCARDDLYAINIRSADSRLSISDSVLYRGRYNGSRPGWTGKGGSLRATLNVSEVQPGETKDLRITICRRGADNPYSSNWRYGCENVLVTVKKDQLNFSLKPAINTDKSSMSTEEKDVTITTATVRNEGPNNSQASAYTVLRFLAKNSASSQLKGSVVGENIDSPISPGSKGWQCELAKRIAQSRGGAFDQSSCDVKYTQENDPSIPKDAVRDLRNSMGEKVKDDINGLTFSPGDSLCYLTAVSNYTQGATMQRFRYAMKCLTVAKKPNVQVWGGDVKTNKQVITSITNVKSIKETSLNMSPDQVRAAGLWPTGYNSQGHLLTNRNGNETDGHWSLVCAKNNNKPYHYQRAYSHAWNGERIMELPNCNDSVLSADNNKLYQAITVAEQQNHQGNFIGRFRCPPYNTAILGDADWCPGWNGAWMRDSVQARWVSINSHGIHTSSNSRPDPSKGADYSCGGTDPVKGIYLCGNTYVFRLSGVNFSNINNLKSIRLGFRGAVDNLVQVRINGKPGRMSGSSGGGGVRVFQNYANSGWAADSTFYTSFEGEELNSIKPTDNTIDIHVISDYSHIGLLIEDITVSYTEKTSENNLYGSWAEYGIAASEVITSSSGAGLSSNRDGRQGAITPREYNKLTFANTPSFGSFADNLATNTFTPPTIPGGERPLAGNWSQQSGVYTGGDMTLSGTTIGAGKSIMIKSNGTVRITGNLLYENTSDVAKLPQLIISAKNIIIDPGVTEVNAWLIAPSGYVSTCGAVVNMNAWLMGESPNNCAQQLRVNGPIMADRLFLKRVYGGIDAANTHKGTPAEILNLRADSYIWGYYLSRSGSTIRTTNIKELPPRY